MMLSRAATNATISSMFTPLRKQVFVSTVRLCHGSKETALTEKDASRSGINQVDNNKNQQEVTSLLSGGSRRRKLDRRDRFVLYMFDKKGRFKSYKDVPDEIDWASMSHAYDKQRVFGMFFMMSLASVICFTYAIYVRKKMKKRLDID